MTDKPAKGPATYFPSIERTYGRPIAEWQAIIRASANALEYARGQTFEHVFANRMTHLRAIAGLE